MAEKEKKTAEVSAEEEVKEAVAEEETPELSEFEKKELEVKELNDKYLRLAAEYDNFRKRTAKEKETLYGDAASATIGAFLSVYDNLERAVGNETTDENYKKGVELIFAGFCDILEKLNVEIISPVGENFDPNFHNAVMHEENENFGENTVSEVFQKGMKCGERVIRPAMVKVAN